MKLRLKRSVLMAGRMKGWPLFRSDLDRVGGPLMVGHQKRLWYHFSTVFYEIFSKKICVTGLTEAERPILEFIYPYMIFILADKGHPTRI